MSDHEFTSLLRLIEHHLAKIADVVCNAPQPIDENRAYCRKDAARLLGVSTGTIDIARRAGRLKEVPRLGVRYVRITGESMLAYQRAHRFARVQVLKI